MKSKKQKLYKIKDKLDFDKIKTFYFSKNTVEKRP